ncbi:MAG: hypothetical protein ABR538_02555 [Candidatus Binatia bacterium]
MIRVPVRKRASGWKAAWTALLIGAAVALATPLLATAQDEAAPSGEASDSSATKPAMTQKAGPSGTAADAKPAGPGGEAKPAPPAKAKTKAAPAKGIHVAPVTPVAPSVRVNAKVLDQCRLQTLLPETLAQQNSEVVLSSGAGAMKLELTIIDIHAPSGGVFSGPKWMTVEGRLLQGKTVKGTFVAKETSMASASVCGMLQKVTVVLAADIAAWLQNPQKGSKLGSAR